MPSKFYIQCFAVVIWFTYVHFEAECFVITLAKSELWRAVSHRLPFLTFCCRTQGSRVWATSSICDDLKKQNKKHAMYPTVHKVVHILLYEFNGEIPSELFNTKIKFTKTPAR